MIEKLMISEIDIPDGILHDQNLYNIALENNILTLSFETHYYPNDYTNTAFAQKYKDFTKCHIKCSLDNESFCNVELKTTLNKNNEYKAKTIPITEFVQIAFAEINKRCKKGYYTWEYISTAISPNYKNALIELSIWLKYKRTEYTNCTLCLYTDKIEYIWE